MLLDGIVSLLKADATVGALIADRCYKRKFPRKYALPAVVVHAYNATQEYDYAGPVGVQEDMVQIDAYDDGTTGNVDVLVGAIRGLLTSFTGALPDGTVVQACYLDRANDPPYMPYVGVNANTDRSILGFRVVTTRM